MLIFPPVITSSHIVGRVRLHQSGTYPGPAEVSLSGSTVLARIYRRLVAVKNTYLLPFLWPFFIFKQLA